MPLAVISLSVRGMPWPAFALCLPWPAAPGSPCPTSKKGLPGDLRWVGFLISR